VVTTFGLARELFLDANVAFARRWEFRTGDRISPVLAVLGGKVQDDHPPESVRGDVLALPDVREMESVVARTGLVSPDWRKSVPGEGAPFTSAVVLVVRSGNPKGVRDWEDLVKGDVRVVSANPRVSAAGRWNYLAAWAAAARRAGGDEAAVRRWMQRLGTRLTDLDSSGRGASYAFTRQNVGDVLLTFESEAYQLNRGETSVETVRPSLSLRVEPVVTWAERPQRNPAVEELARAYVGFLFGETGQAVAARHGFRPRDAEVLRRYADRFPPIEVLTVDEAFGGWRQAYETHFRPGGVCDAVWRK
jgi:sulfate transport system substrate-binding protein